MKADLVDGWKAGHASQVPKRTKRRIHGWFKNQSQSYAAVPLLQREPNRNYRPSVKLN